MNPMANSEQEWTLATADTALALAVREDRLYLVSLKGPAGNDWTTRSAAEVKLPSRLAAGYVRRAPEWAFRSAAWETIGSGGTELTLRFHDAASGTALSSVWTAHAGPGPVQHRLVVENMTELPILLYEPESLDIVVGADEDMDVFYVHKDRAAATIMSYMRSGYGTYLEPLRDRYAMDIWTKPDDDDTGFIPLVMLHARSGRGLYVGWAWNHGRIAVRGTAGEAAGETASDALLGTATGEGRGAKLGTANEDARASARGAAGSAPVQAEIRAGMFDDFCAEIAPRTSFGLPAAFIGAFDGDIDDGSNRLRKWLFRHMMPEINRTNENLPYVAWNAFYNTATHEGSWVCKEDRFYPMVDAVAKIGVEEVAVDVGWWEGYGDWRSSAANWPQGMRAASDYAHERGLAFGLYFTLTNGESLHPEALTSEGENGKPGWFVDNLKADLGVPECSAFVGSQLERRFDDYGVDVLRTDYEPIVTRKADGNKHRGCNDAAYWAEEAFLKLLDRFEDERPGFRYQNCSGGGALKGYAVMKRSSTVQTTDYFEAVNVRRAVWDSVYCFPLMQLLTQFGDIASGGIVGSAGYRFRTYLMGAPSMHVELPTEMSESDRATLARLIAAYKEKVRPLVRRANVYHNLPRPDGVSWDGLELYDPETGKGLTMVFKPDCEEDERIIRWKGLEPEAEYAVAFEDGTNPPARMTGAELMASGLNMRLEGRFVAEWVFIERTN
ncbi:alpha-galactosidase [Paenibacillus sacheonensis]|uniref:Glycosyl hydrolase family 36 C-terminal domain-containing protein n=1 Tax=Paenibacillus sacheonensis TaxID=742054 RepID=A0A7X4YQV3_9BACL|nr:alpha-galactosidase [Paenibacillus sacheonensis]MBM7567218.1 hypothetical protein [Paenibacillus sacheonensis]NBC70857.1 hypothetical protein [Paenibacillus sacheonensis]